jgi:hypothetical protein
VIERSWQGIDYDLLISFWVVLVPLTHSLFNFRFLRQTSGVGQHNNGNETLKKAENERHTWTDSRDTMNEDEVKKANRS